MVTEPRLDVDDIQGHILPGYGSTDALLLGVRADDGTALRQLLSALAPQVVTARAALGQRASRKLARVNSQALLDDGVQVNLALSRTGLDLLGYRERGIDSAFDAGMTGLSTGDPKLSTLADGSPEPAHPSNWVIGGPNHPLDALVLILARRDIRERAARIAEPLAALPGIRVVYREFGEDLEGSREHFGFQDGISLPGMYGEYEDDGGRLPITTRYGVPPRNGLEFGKPGQPLVWPGRFLVGPPDVEDGPTSQAGTIWENGSFLVFRRLVQDVARFYADTEALAATLAGSVPGLDGPKLRSAVVGRSPDGQSLMRSGPEDNLSLNHFFYATDTPALNLPGQAPILGAPRDVGGGTCPFWAHVRKVNPRDGLNDLQTEAHNLQMLRRGVPFGPAYDHANPAAAVNQVERGLLFLAYQRQIAEQFEKLNSHWMNQFDVPAGGGHDLLVGLAVSGGRLVPRRAEWPLTGVPFATPNTWVRPTGGAYLFAPSLNAIRRLATTPGPG